MTASLFTFYLWCIACLLALFGWDWLREKIILPGDRYEPHSKVQYDADRQLNAFLLRQEKIDEKWVQLYREIMEERDD